MKPLTDEKRKDVFIVDDSLFDSSRSKKVERLARVFNHCSMKYRSGFRMLTLGWSDGNSFVPVSHCLLSATEDKNLLCEGNPQPNKKRRGHSRYLLSVPVTVEKDDESILAKFVYVRNKSRRKDWLVLVSTDTELSEEGIIRVYGKRWDTEAFFKAFKSYLTPIKEYRGISHDAMNAHVAIVFACYMMLGGAA